MRPVPVGLGLPKKVKTEVLAKLFLPRGNGNDKSPEKLSKKNLADDDFLDDLENEAKRITGNLKTSKNGKITAWIPSGTIRVQDTRLGVIPVSGCKVQVRKNFFVTNSAITNANGQFYISDTYNDPECYKIKWDRDEFDIRSNQYGQAETFSAPISRSWNPVFDSFFNTIDYLYATVHRAAVTYYYNASSFGLTPPPNKSYFAGLGIIGLIGHKIHIGVGIGSGFGTRAHYFDFNDNWFAAEVKIRFDPINGNWTERQSEFIFATAIHELAHVAHWKMGFTTANYLIFNQAKLAESWAQVVGWRVTSIVYGLPEDSEFHTVEGLQYLTLNNQITSRYTSIFIDLIDNVSQPNCSGDAVSGYTLSQLESYLKQQPRSWNGYRDYLFTNSSVPNLANAHLLFNLYRN